MSISSQAKKTTVIAMICAIAYVVMVVARIKVGDFLTYEPKDVVITIGGFMLGPLSALIISLIVSFFEMISISNTGPIGMLMNVLATCAFACTASFIYRKKHNIAGAVIGLASGLVLMTVTMILWNYLITPLYLSVPRQTVVEMIIPLLLPFNLLKAGVNMGLTMLLYKPVVTALRKANLLPQSNSGKVGKFSIGFSLVTFAFLCTCVLLLLAFAGII